jgi:hypothetical protein
MNALFSALLGALQNLFPPVDPSNPTLSAHLRSNFLLVMALSMLGAFHIAWVCGYLPGNPGVAWAADVAKKNDQQDGQINQLRLDLDQKFDRLSHGQDGMELLLVRSSLRESEHDLCIAIRQHDQAMMTAVNREIGTLSDRFYALAGRPYVLDNCETVLAQ